MINYKQLYKDEIIVTIVNNDGVNQFDTNLTNNKIFYAVGSKTSNDLSQVSQVKRIALWCVKPNSIINFSGGGTCEIFDDAGPLMTMNFNGYQNYQFTAFKPNTPHALNFTNEDSNIQFKNFNSDGMTVNINNLNDKSNVSEFNATVTVPNDVKCNYNTGTYKFINNQAVNILFDGDIKKGDTITIKRNNRNDLNSEINFDTDLAFSNIGMAGTSNMEIIYKHAKEEIPTPEPQTVTFLSEDDGIKWSNTTMQDYGKDFHNSIIIQKGYELKRPLAVEFTDKQDQTKTLTYGTGQSIHYDGDDTSKNTWDLTINTGYKKINILAGQTKYKQYELIPNLQNAKIIVPESVVNDYGDTAYYLDPKHTTITLQANDGYTFESDGSLTYYIDDVGDTGEYTIKATHTNTVTFNLPDDINWIYQGNFILKMGAVKAEIVETTGGFTNIYKADYTNLLKFSNEIILKTVGGSSGNLQAYDVTPYINNLILLPFNVPSGEKSNIVAGNEIFKTQLSTVDNNYLHVDLGTINIPETYKNGYDYYNVKTRLMLPYTNMIELDPVHVINQTISIKYIVNVINGDTTINLLNGDDLFYSEQVNLASEVPFISNARKGTQYAVINRLKTVFKNSINQAYIIIEQPSPILNSEYYPTNEKGTLKGYNGNVKCTLLNNININANELNALQNLLNNGVNIK